MCVADSAWIERAVSEILYSAGDGIASVQINRPERRNALTTGTASQLYDVLLQASEDKIRVLVLRGVGKDFCCGADIGMAASKDAGGVPLDSDMRIYQISRLLHDMPAVTIAAIRGGCAGAGFGWACACDLRFADDTARINTAFLDVGVAGDMAGVWLLSRIVGAGRAREMYMLPGKYGAAGAERIGLVNRVFAGEKFEAELEAIVTRLGQAPPLALAAMKANFVEAERIDLSSYIALESERHERLLRSEDRKEAFRAFLEKRPGRFKAA